jgi:hypothetical protein
MGVIARIDREEDCLPDDAHEAHGRPLRCFVAFKAQVDIELVFQPDHDVFHGADSVLPMQPVAHFILDGNLVSVSIVHGAVALFAKVVLARRDANLLRLVPHGVVVKEEGQEVVEGQAIELKQVTVPMSEILIHRDRNDD